MVAAAVEVGVAVGVEGGGRSRDHDLDSHLINKSPLFTGAI
jgi:hypothetical protein